MLLITALVAEIKENEDKRQKEDTVLTDIAAESRHPASGNLEFEYSNTGIHEDLHKLIEYSCGELCTTKEQLNKVMRIWTSFVEPMLGVFSQPHSSEGTECVNGDESASPDRVDSCRINFVKVDNLVKENGYWLEKELKNATTLRPSDNASKEGTGAMFNVNEVPSSEV